MLFHSIEYLILLVVVFALSWNTPLKYRWIPLLGASYVFYMWWKPLFILLIIATTLVNYFIALYLPQKRPGLQKLLLIGSLVFNIGLLFYFKYANFFLRELQNLLNGNETFDPLNIILPMGISFYTFQTQSYVIDVYKKVRAPEKHLGVFAVYISFFPQLVAGPIESSTTLLPQLSQKREFNYSLIRSGFYLILWGFFKKLLIADRVASTVETVYSNPENFSGPALALATLLFTIQIYCDFSAYSDIAIGSARLIGFDLQKNFNTPYTSRSITEFWQRWHITLTKWFTQYLYIPLGGNRASKSKWLFNILIVFIISGVWHGANWTFIVWGLIHGVLIIREKLLPNLSSKAYDLLDLSKLPRLSNAISILLTFIALNYTWVFFRANNLNDAIYIVSHLHVGLWDWIIISAEQLLALKVRPFIELLIEVKQKSYDFALLGVSGLIILTIHYFKRTNQLTKIIDSTPLYLRWIIYAIFISFILIFGTYNNNDFIYFQF